MARTTSKSPLEKRVIAALLEKGVDKQEAENDAKEARQYVTELGYDVEYAFDLFVNQRD